MGIPTSQIDPAQASYSLYEGIEYQDYWLGHQKAKLDELEHRIIEQMLPVSGNRILDVGCGFGRLSSCYLGRYKEAVMMDGSLSLLKQAQQMTNYQAVYIAGDVDHPPFQEGSFDTALMIRVLHHLPDAHHILGELQRVLLGEGQLVFTYYNKRNPASILLWLLGRISYHPFTLRPEKAKSHLLAHHPKDIRNELVKTGFQFQTELGAGVIDKAARFSKRFWKVVPTGLALAPFVGRMHLAPWIFCGAQTLPKEVPQAPLSIEDLFQCPSCKIPVERTENAMICSGCSQVYPIIDGIYDFRLPCLGDAK